MIRNWDQEYEPPRAEEGYAYIFHSPRTGLAKIGWSRRPHDRFDAIKPYAPGLQLVGLVASDKPRWLEKYLHTAYCHGREEAEWFALTTEELDELRSLPDFAGVEAELPPVVRVRYVEGYVNSVIAEGGDVYLHPRTSVVKRFMMLGHLAGGMRVPNDLCSRVLNEALAARLADLSAEVRDVVTKLIAADE